MVRSFVMPQALLLIALLFAPLAAACPDPGSENCDPIVPVCVWVGDPIQQFDVVEVELDGAPLLTVASIRFSAPGLPTFQAANAHTMNSGASCDGPVVDAVELFTPYECDSGVVPDPLHLREATENPTGTYYIGWLHIDIDGDRCADQSLPWVWYEPTES